MKKIYDKLDAWYEAGAYRFNPCDVGSHAALRPVGRALAGLVTYCPCCSGARVLIAAVAGALAPVPTLAVLAALMIWFGLRPAREEPQEEEDQPIIIQATVTYKDKP
jgi:hypothetical protein